MFISVRRELSILSKRERASNVDCPWFVEGRGTGGGLRLKIFIAGLMAALCLVGCSATASASDVDPIYIDFDKNPKCEQLKAAFPDELGSCECTKYEAAALPGEDGGTIDLPGIGEIEIRWDIFRKQFDFVATDATVCGIAVKDGKVTSNVYVWLYPYVPPATSDNDLYILDDSGSTMRDISWLTIFHKPTVPVPEFPSLAVPAITILGLVGVIMYIKK